MLPHAQGKVLLLGALFALSLVGGTRRFAVLSAPKDRDTLVNQALAAVNAHDFGGLNGLISGDAKTQFAWIKETTTKHWEGGVLMLPASNESLAVFHAWHTCESDGDHVHRLLKTAGGWQIGGEIPETETGGFRVRDHNLQVSIDPAAKTAAIQDGVTIERTGKDTAAACLLRISQDFKVTSAAVKDGSPLAFQQVGGIVAFHAPAERKFQIELRYSGVVNHAGSDYIRPNEATLDSYWYPHIARQPATATVRAIAPRGWTPIAQGELVRQSSFKNGALDLTFRNNIPTCFFTVDFGTYTITTRKVKNRTYAAYLLKPNPKLAESSLDLIASSMAYYEAHFGKFPYTHYAVVETQGQFAGALEAYSFSTYGPDELPSTIPHELSHTWWGGVVPCAYTRSMWNESFAEYSDGLFHRQTEPDNPGRGAARMVRGHSGSAFTAFSLTTAHDTSDNRQTSMGYGKGPLVLRVLEDEIGKDTMLRCMAEFYAHYRDGDSVEWADFETVLNKITGGSYRWFFAQWMERTGLPTVRLTNVTQTQDGGKTVVEADIVQEGTPYRLRLPLVLATKGDNLTQTVIADGAATHIRLTTAAAPIRLAVDPRCLVPISIPAGSTEAESLQHDFH